MHEISKENMLYVLNQAEYFTNKDLEFIEEQFDVDSLYGEKSSVIDLRTVQIGMNEAKLS